MVMMVMVMVMVPKALSQVGWLRQCQCQSFNRLKPSIGQSFHKLRVQWAQRFLWKRFSCRNAALKRGSEAGSEAGSQVGFQSGSQSGSQAGSEAATQDALNECVSTSEAFRQSRLAEVLSTASHI